MSSVCEGEVFGALRFYGGCDLDWGGLGVSWKDFLKKEFFNKG